jgi:hypothetical protein
MVWVDRPRLGDNPPPSRNYLINSFNITLKEQLLNFSTPTTLGKVIVPYYNDGSKKLNACISLLSHMVYL